MNRVLVALALASVPFVAARASAQAPSEATTQAAPRADGCGMTEENATFRELAVGDVVTLQRHRWVRGEANWRDEMGRYVGRAARVTRLSGVDAQGCSGIRVDVDHEQYFWRVRDVGIGTGRQEAQATQGAASGFPQECHQQDGAEHYGAASIGAQVVLGRHRPVDGDTNWSEDMSQFVGRSARVVGPAGVDGQGCPGVRVDIDRGDWFWRIRDLRGAGAASDLASLTLVPSTGVSTDHGRPAISSVGGGSGLFGAGGVPGPQACGLTDDTMQWESLTVGSEVILGRHRAVSGDDNWDAQMDPFVGRTAHITELIGVDETGCGVVHVDVDNGQWFWRARDLVITQPGPGGGGMAPPGPGVGPGVGSGQSQQVSLAPGFRDPRTVTVAAGGPVTGDGMGSADGYCAGSFPAAPQITLTLTAPLPNLRVLGRSTEDTTLAIRFPDGQVQCNDDGAGYPNPAVDIPRAAAGTYQIFVGAFGSGGMGAQTTIGFTTNLGLSSDQLP
jgi:hypothetical protein